MHLSAGELFSRIDAGHGGPLHTFKRRMKFTLRHAWFRQDIARLDRSFAQRGLQSLPVQDAHLLVKATRPYLWTGLGGAQRFAAQQLHFDWLLAQWTLPQVQRFYARGVADLAHWNAAGHVCGMQLRAAQGPVREGELELLFTLDGHLVKRSAFSVLPAHWLGLDRPGAVMVVGSMQGARECKDRVKQATSLLERTKPRAMVFHALQGLAQAWGLSAMVGVSDAGHVYAGYRSLSRRVGASYDELWQELGARQRLTPQLWELPLHWIPRPESEVESRKRSQLRRRNALRQQVVDLCARGARDLPGAL